MKRIYIGKGEKDEVMKDEDEKEEEILKKQIIKRMKGRFEKK